MDMFMDVIMRCKGRPRRPELACADLGAAAPEVITVSGIAA